MIIHEDNRLKNIEPELYTMLGEVADYYEKASGLASNVAEKMARKILKEHPELDEFIMAMGSYFFTYKNSSKNLRPMAQKMNKGWNHYYEDSESFLKPLNGLISEWDSVLKITGGSMRFTANGVKITEW